MAKQYDTLAEFTWDCLEANYGSGDISSERKLDKENDSRSIEELTAQALSNFYTDKWD